MRFSDKTGGIPLYELINAIGGVPAHGLDLNRTVYGYSTDSRRIGENEIFIGIHGEKANGCDYVGDAVKNGAICAITDKPTSDELPTVLVKDTASAIAEIGRYFRRRYDVMTVAVTGSVGKTTTKEYTSCVLSRKFTVCKTDGNMNNELGVPMTLMKLGPEHGAAVIEMGMSQRGEISKLVNISMPNIAIITNVGSSHLEFLHTRENICKAKYEILDGITPDGTLLINGDDELLVRNNPNKTRTVTVGISSPDVDVRAVNVRECENGMIFDAVSSEYVISDMHIPSPGRHTVYAALFAIVCGKLVGLSDCEIRAGLADYRPVALHQSISQIDGCTIISDCYNASPESMRASMNVMRQIARGRRIAVLGKMLEIGADTLKLHRDTGEYTKPALVDELWIFGDGDEENELEKGAKSAGVTTVRLGSDVDHAVKYIKENKKTGDTLLFKASRLVKLERLTDGL